MSDIVLATLNARWTHASLGLRYLMANLGALQSRAVIEEFTIATPLEPMIERILSHQPRVLGLGVYIWNVEQTTALIRRLRQFAPALKIVLGGPEVSHETQGQTIVGLADHVITGPGDLSFAVLARQLLDGPRPLTRIIAGVQPELSDLALPYRLYTAQDLAHRHLYIEASRGCPFKCEFCLSALDKTAWPFALDTVLDELAQLYERGARRFRFVDRTFNLKAATGRAILDFFLARLAAAPGDPVFAHFELVPDHLPDALKAAIARFPAGALQFEIGIQTWNPQVQALISRRQDNEQAQANLRWLREHTQAHLHVDLIGGLPGETLESFGAGFDRLVALRPHEIQVGVLKRLRGAPIARHSASHCLRFAEDPPYAVIETAAVPATDMARLTRFARYWDLYANSGRFADTLPLLLSGAAGAHHTHCASDLKPGSGANPPSEEQPSPGTPAAQTSAFRRFMAFSDWLTKRLGTSHRLALETQAEALLAWLVNQDGQDPDQVTARLTRDYTASGARGKPGFMSKGLAGGRRAATSRQALHLETGTGRTDESTRD